MTKLRVGIVGVGAIALTAHIPNYAKRDDVEVVAYVDLDTDRATKMAWRFEVDYHKAAPRVYCSLEEMVQKEAVDAVSICTPNKYHAEIAVKAVELGLHVLLEKPMTTSLAEAQRLTDIVLGTDRIFMVGMPHRFRDDATALKRFIDAGDVGNIYYAKTCILRRRGTPKGWFTDSSRSGGGPLMDIGVHALDLAWWMMGKPKISAASGFMTQGIGKENLDFVNTWSSKDDYNQSNEVYTTEDFASAFLRFHNGSVLQLEVSWSLNGAQDDALKLDIYGSKGGVSLAPLQYYSTHHGMLTATMPSVPVGDFFATEINHFVECVQAGSRTLVDVEDGRDVMRMLEMIRTSSELGHEIR